jgi:cell division protease FtsH
MKKRKNQKKVLPFHNPRNFLLLIIFLLISLGIMMRLTEYTQNMSTISYSDFVNKVESGDIKSVVISGNEAQGFYKDGKRFETVIANNPKNWDLLKKYNVDITVSSEGTGINWTYAFILLSLLIVPLSIFFILRQAKGGSGGGGGPGIFTMGKSKAKMFPPSTIKENFDSVAGAKEAKEELQDVVDYLKNPKKYERLGAKLTRGVLMVGAPGTGKTLLARAVAGEANCPFFSISGSDFIEVFVGVGASRVRDLFAQARKNAPCIIFIDEIDAVGRQRGSGLGGGHDEREQTLNQLLTEMDGFETSGDPIVVIAATNRPDVLDKALLRPGRFDRRVDVPYPDLKSREDILAVHAAKVKMDPTVDLAKVARATPGFTGADLANLINEAAISASKADQDSVTIENIEEARDKIMIGKPLKTIQLTQDDRALTAFHEAGHALVRLLMPKSTDPLHKVTIVPRGRALGVTHYLPEREKYTISHDEMIADIMAALGGSIAEDVVFNKMTTGAYSDFRGATKLARNMITRYGMSPELGSVVYEPDEHGYIHHSQATAEKIDNEVRRVVEECKVKAKKLLQDNRDKLDKLANALLEKETMHAGEIYALLGIEPREDHKLV